VSVVSEEGLTWQGKLKRKEDLPAIRTGLGETSKLATQNGFAFADDWHN
jgi:hypothetical protein